MYKNILCMHHISKVHFLYGDPIFGHVDPILLFALIKKLSISRSFFQKMCSLLIIQKAKGYIISILNKKVQIPSFCRDDKERMKSGSTCLEGPWYEKCTLAEQMKLR